MEHFGTVEGFGSALLERLDPLTAVARLRRLGSRIQARNRQGAVGAVIEWLFAVLAGPSA
jgi:hypothetical protein